MAQIILSLILFPVIFINSSYAESCTESPCEHDGVCTTIDASSVHCSCAPGYTGQHCDTPVTGLWTPLASVECNTACEAFNSTPVITGYQPPNKIPFYVCGTLFAGYRTGYKKHGQPSCQFGPGSWESSLFSCLCEGRMVWVAASGGQKCFDACAKPVFSGSHIFGTWVFSTNSFYVCRTPTDGYKIGGFQLDGYINNDCSIHGGIQTSEKECLCHGESCSQIPCKNSGFCSTVDATTVHCSCQPGYSGHHCDIKVTALWAPEGTTDCNTACEALGSSPVVGGYDHSTDTTLYICAGTAYGDDIYRGGYKIHGQPSCLICCNQVAAQFRCLCDGQKNFEWITASTGSRCSETCKNPVVTSSYKFSLTAPFSRMPFHLCRSVGDGYIQVGQQLNEHLSNKCRVYPNHQKVDKECLCYKELVADEEFCDRYNGLHIQNNETCTNSCFILHKNAYNYEDSSSLCKDMATEGWHGRLAILADDRVFKAVWEGLTDVQFYPVWTGFRTKDSGNTFGTWKWYDGDVVVFNHTAIPGVQLSLTTDSYGCAYLDLAAFPPRFAEYNCLNIRYLLCEFVFEGAAVDNVGSEQTTTNSVATTIKLEASATCSRSVDHNFCERNKGIRIIDTISCTNSCFVVNKATQNYEDSNFECQSSAGKGWRARLAFIKTETVFKMITENLSNQLDGGTYWIGLKGVTDGINDVKNWKWFDGDIMVGSYYWIRGVQADFSTASDNCGAFRINGNTMEFVSENCTNQHAAVCEYVNEAVEPILEPCIPGENCANSPCKNGGHCATINSTSVHCACQPDYTGQYCSIPVPALWSPEDSTECSTACEALGSTAMISGYQSSSNKQLYVCSSGYRSGYKIHGVAGCHNGRVIPTFRCLCTGELMDWKAAEAGHTCSQTCEKPVVAGFHGFCGAAFCTNPFQVCRDGDTGHKAAGYQLDGHTVACLVQEITGIAEKDCLCHKGLCHTDELNLVNAYGTSSGWEYNKSGLNVTCIPDHRNDRNISAESSITHCMNGTWSPQSIVCRGVCNINNLRFEHGSLNGTGLIFDKEAVVFSCDDGMVMTGNKSINSSVVHCNGIEWTMFDGNLTCVNLTTAKPVQVISNGHFKIAMGQLINKEISELSGIRSPIECGGRCLMEDGCVSFNYFKQCCGGETGGKCQLNGKRRGDVTHAQFLTTPDVVYGEVVRL